MRGQAFEQRLSNDAVHGLLQVTALGNWLRPRLFR